MINTNRFVLISANDAKEMSFREIINLREMYKREKVDVCIFRGDENMDKNFQCITYYEYYRI